MFIKPQFVLIDGHGQPTIGVTAGLATSALRTGAQAHMGPLFESALAAASVLPRHSHQSELPPILGGRCGSFCCATVSAAAESFSATLAASDLNLAHNATDPLALVAAWMKPVLCGDYEATPS